MHGHEVGGTNPSLLEALATTQLNLLLDVGFNNEVAKDSALYWTKKSGSLKSVLEHADSMQENEIDAYASKAKDTIKNRFSWKKIVGDYEKEFLK